jgi:hypothetical protein
MISGRIEKRKTKPQNLEWDKQGDRELPQMARLSG